MNQPKFTQAHDDLLNTYVSSVPFLRFMNIRFEHTGDTLTAIMAFDQKIIGNAMINRLHGGAIASFLESTATMTLAWKNLWDKIDSGELDSASLSPETLPPLPKTINLTTDYLRPGLPQDAYASATINRAGRRYASIQVKAWQNDRNIPFARATGHFLMPEAKP